MTRYTILLPLLLIAGACSADPVPVVVTPPVTTTETATPVTLVKCGYKYDSKYNIEFLKQNKAEYRPPYLPELIVYHITDTIGKRWSVNSYEMENYVCTETLIPKG